MPRTSTQLSGKTANSITTLADGEKAARRYLMSDLNTVANNPNNHAINARSIVKDYVRQVTLNQIKTTFAEITGQIEQLTLSDSEKTALLEKTVPHNPFDNDDQDIVHCAVIIVLLNNERMIAD